jgi:hypothetical protein
MTLSYNLGLALGSSVAYLLDELLGKPIIGLCAGGPIHTMVRNALTSTTTAVVSNATTAAAAATTVTSTIASTILTTLIASTIGPTTTEIPSYVVQNATTTMVSVATSVTFGYTSD